MDYHLKQRLVGAAVLIGIGVIFIPMLLDGPVEQVEPQRTTGIPLVMPEAERTPPVRETREAPAEVAAEPPPQAAQPVRENDPAPAGDWAVQLGSFAARENAEALASRVRGHHFQVFVQEVLVENGRMYRVRVGPVATRTEAERLVTRVQEATGERAVVVTHP